MRKSATPAKPQCPACGNPLTFPGLDLATNKPCEGRAGDGALCSHCATYLTYTGPREVRLATPEEAAEGDQVRVAAFQEAILSRKIRPRSESGR